MTPRLPFLFDKKGNLGVIHEWRHLFFSFTHSGGKIYQMGDIIHGWHPDYLFLLNKKGCLGVIHEWHHRTTPVIQLSKPIIIDIGNWHEAVAIYLFIYRRFPYSTESVNARFERCVRFFISASSRFSAVQEF